MSKDDLTYAGDPVEDFDEDRIPAWMDTDDPVKRAEIRAAMREARARFARLINRPCPFGNCRVLIDPVDNTVEPFFGLAGCGCSMLPGRNARHYDGLPKPGWNTKPVGRHGGRIARSRHKHASHARWLKDVNA